jgi:regulator of PEP synthase PpsR (kinase-PPPase family)
VLDEDYYKRIEAIQFTMSHDDGKIINDIEKSDVVLLGISRTSRHQYQFIWQIEDIKLATYQ